MSEKQENINSENTNRETQAPKTKKSFVRRFFKWSFILFAFLILLLIGIFIFIQTDTFDKIALDIILDKVNSSLAAKDSKIYAESLTGNILKGFNLNNGSVTVKSDTLLKFNSIQADYNIWTLLNKEISVQNLILKDPQINLTKIKDKNDSLKWNLSYLLEPEVKDEDTAKSEFDWSITAENVSIENGALRILEEKNPNLPIRNIMMNNLDTFQFGYFDIKDLNLNLSAKYFPDFKSVDIKNISFNTNSDFNINQLSLQASVNEEDLVTKVENLKLITNRTNLIIRELLMDKLDPFAGIDYEHFENNDTKIELEADKFNFKDLTYFLPSLNFLDSSVYLNMKAAGKYGDLNINQLDLRTPNSKYSFTGNVKNLDEPSKLYFNIHGKDLELDGIDTKVILPGLEIPNYSYLGKVYISSLTYEGEPLKFSSDFDIRSSAGNVDGKVYFDLTQNVTRYKGDITTSNLNIGKIIKDTKLESNVNGDFRVDASGFDYRTMSGKLNYDLRRTKVYGQNISNSAGHLEFNRGNVNLDISYFSDAVKTKMKGRVNISNLNNISYDLKGSTSSLNIAAFTKDNSQSSNLNFDFDIKGSGFDPNSLTGNFKINMNSSTFGDYKIPAAPLVAEIDQNGNIKNISLLSNFVDLKASGQFDINTLINTLNANADKIKSELSSKIFYDSAIKILDTENQSPGYNSPGRDFNLNYAINIKDLSPLYAFIGDSSLFVIAADSGMVSDSSGVLNLTSYGLIKVLRYKDSVINLKNATFDLTLSNDINGMQLTKFNADANFFAKNFLVNNFPLDSTIAKINFFDNKNKFLISTNRDSTVKLFTEGNVTFDSTIVTFDSLALKYNEFFINNINDLVLMYNNIDTTQSLEFRKFSLRSGTQRLTIAGQYSLNDSSDIKLSADNIKIATYQKLLTPDADTSNLIAGNIRRIELQFKGTVENPNYHLEANSDVLKIGKTRIGRLDAFVNYEDNEIKPDISFYNINNTGSFKLTGIIPFLNPATKSEIDSVERAKLFAGKEVNLIAKANNFQLKVFQQVLPYTSNVEGILDGQINLNGTAEDPVLTGDMDISKGKVYVTMNRMQYSFNAVLATANEKLLINNSKLFVEDEPSSFITTSGYIDFSGLNLNDINLEMVGSVRVLSKDNPETEFGMSGDLYVGGGNPKLRIKGNSERIDLTGNLLLIKGNVILDPFVQQVYNIYSDDFIYGVIIDSLKSPGDSVGKIILQSTDSVVILNNLSLNPFEKILYISSNSNLKKEARGTSGKFFYNLYITTSDNVFLKFIVNRKTQQEFFGEIKTELYLDNRDNYSMGARGVVTLGDNCYYKFFRKFDATGRVNFNGNITNPELDISATYKGKATVQSGSTSVEQVDVTINLKVTGPATNPLLTITLDRDGVAESGSAATSDAISFLLFGKFQNQLSFGESSSLGANIGASFLSNYLSSSIENIFPFLINTDVNYVDSRSGSVAENTDIRFTAEVGDAIIRFGGQLFKGIANTDIVIDYPLNKLIKSNVISNNLMLRLERVIDPYSVSQNIINPDATKTGGLIFYRIKF